MQEELEQPPAIASVQTSMPSPPTIKIGGTTRVAPAQRNMRGRIHVQNDVINGISGLEHLSNTLNTRPKGINASPQITAQMRPSPYQHHSSQPESALLQQLGSLNLNNNNQGGLIASPMIASNANITNLKSSQSRSNLPSMPELEYDPWRANQ